MSPESDRSALLTWGVAHLAELEALARKRRLRVEADEKVVKAERERVLTPLQDRKRYYDLPAKVFEDRIRQLMATYVGFARNEDGLKLGVQKLEDLKGWIPNLKARNFHELLRANEAVNLLDSCRLIARAALERKETRLGLYHNRSDYPEKDDVNFKKFIILKRAGDGIDVSFRPVDEV